MRYLLDWKPFKNDEKCFLFHLKSSFRFHDIYVFVTTLVRWEKQLDLKDMFNFKIHDVQPGLQTIVIHILSNISQSIGNQTMKFGQ